MLKKLLILENLLYKEWLKVLNLLHIDGAMSSQAHTSSLVDTPIAKSIIIETKWSNENCRLNYAFVCIPSKYQERMVLQ